MPERPSIVAEIFKLALAAVYGVVLLAAGPPSVWLVLFAHTAVGRGVGVMGLLLIAVAADLFVWFRRPARKGLWGWSTVLLIVGLLGVGYWIVREAPSGRAPAGSPVRHRFATGRAFEPYAPANVVPEVEQIHLALSVAPLLDPILTRAQAGRVREVALPLYDAMAADPNFRALGSAVGGAYAEALGRPFDNGHYYLYAPHGRAAGPRAAVLFLHGSGGNLKAYTWVWSKLAERLGCVVVAPSYGLGNWGRRGAVATAMRALDDAGRAAGIDPDRVVLAGVSSGGIGVCRLAEAYPRRFAGLVLVSPVLAPEIVAGERFRAAWRGRPVLIVTGGADRRVPVEAVREQAAAMASAGLDVRTVIHPKADHFLFFTQRRPVLDAVASWWAGAGRAGTKPATARGAGA